MNLTQDITNWGKSHYRPWMAPARMFFGLFMVGKGLFFIQHSDYVLSWFHQMQFKDVLGVLSVFLAFLHVFLGCLIVIGFATRLSCSVLIFVMLGALFFTVSHQSYVLPILFTVIAIPLCIFFIAEGSGRFSVYYYFKHSNETEPDKLAKSAGDAGLK